ncbi:hypothetical protein AAHB52_30015 [Bacillus toyonensis]
MIFKKLYVYNSNEKNVKQEYTFNTCGLNIIMGERNKTTDETNGVGKSTMIDSINYLLGSSCLGRIEKVML